MVPREPGDAIFSSMKAPAGWQRQAKAGAY